MEAMKPTRAQGRIALAGACLALGSLSLGICRAQEARQAKLAFQVGGPASTTFTPNKLAQGGKSFSIGAEGKVTLAGQEVSMAARYVGSGYMIAMDCDGDGKASASEWAAVDLLRRSASFRLRLPGEGGKKVDLAVRLIEVQVDVRANQVAGARGRIVSDGCMAGTYHGLPILLFDDDFDGVFRQDGKDAIAIGATGAAMPLRQVHQVGKVHCQLRVASDGSTIDFTPLDDPDLGLVETAIPPAMLRCLILDDAANGRSYDVKVSGSTGIPPGTYSLSYAVLGSGSRFAVASPTRQGLTYAIAADQAHLLRFGPPVTLTFPARYEARDQRIWVGTRIGIYGIGGEEYDLRYAGYHALGDPQVLFMNGQATLSTGQMVYDNEDRLMVYMGWAPAGMSRQHGSVVVSADLAVLGRALGSVPMENVLSGKDVDPPTPRQPAVITRRLPAGVVLGKRPPASEPVAKVEPPKPAPAPAAAPAAPAPEPTSRATRPARPLDPEDHAEIILGMAREFLRQGLKSQGVGKLKEILDRYPGTSAAKRAAEMLLDIEIQSE